MIEEADFLENSLDTTFDDLSDNIVGLTSVGNARLLFSNLALFLEDGRIMPALTTISNLGEKAADQIMEAASQGPFLSCEDFKNRCKAGEKTVEQLRELGLLNGLSMTNQISLFDLVAGG